MVNKNGYGGMPQVSEAFDGWTSTIKIVKIKQTIVDALVVNSEVPVSFQGVVQPLSPNQLKLKDEGLRSWEWILIHVTSGKLDLVTNDVIVYNCKKYKVMNTMDWSQSGYVEYHCVEEFRNA